MWSNTTSLIKNLAMISIVLLVRLSYLRENRKENTCFEWQIIVTRGRCIRVRPWNQHCTLQELAGLWQTPFSTDLVSRAVLETKSDLASVPFSFFFCFLVLCKHQLGAAPRVEVFLIYRQLGAGFALKCSFSRASFVKLHFWWPGIACRLNQTSGGPRARGNPVFPGTVGFGWKSEGATSDQPSPYLKKIQSVHQLDNEPKMLKKSCRDQKKEPDLTLPMCRT